MLRDAVPRFPLSARCGCRRSTRQRERSDVSPAIAGCYPSYVAAPNIELRIAMQRTSQRRARSRSREPILSVTSELADAMERCLLTG